MALASSSGASTNQCIVGSDVSSATAARSTTVAYIRPFGFTSTRLSNGNSVADADASTRYLTIWPVPGRSPAGMSPVQEVTFAFGTRRMSATRSSPNMET